MSDHDPFESFRTMTTDLTPPPAAEVRRRGDRLRRRNTALAAVGGTAAALVAIGVPLALTQGDDGGDAAPPIATDVPFTWRTEIPQDFPIEDGLPAPVPGFPISTQPGWEPQAVTGPCDTEPWEVTDALDVLSSIYTDPSEGGIERVLSVYEDAATPGEDLATLREQVATCSSGRITATEVVSDLGEESVSFYNTYDGGFAVYYQVVRVGNAVLFETHTFNGAGDPAVVEQTKDLVQEQSAAVITQMCVFSETPC